MTRRARALALAAALALPALARAETIDRVVARYWAPETGGAAAPRLVFGRELAFEARLEALSDPDQRDADAPTDRHVRAALERHVAVDVLSRLPLAPAPSAEEVARRAEETREELGTRARGLDKLLRAAAVEGLDDAELDAILRREARASLYVDRRFGAVLSPSLAELREVHRSVASPFRGRPFDEVAVAFRRYWVGQRVAAAVAAFYQSARGRISLYVVPRGGA